jgi:succinate dehydrogenase / fumarate reductase cytochrome b subunit
MDGRSFFTPTAGVSMAQVSRPTSPHLTIYKWQITMVLSILHRMTGAALYFGSLLFILWLCIAAYAPPYYEQLHKLLASIPGQICLMGWSFSLFLHLANGIRHLFWDMGYGYSVPVANRSGIAVLLLTLLATVALWLGIYHQLGKI